MTWVTLGMFLEGVVLGTCLPSGDKEKVKNKEKESEREREREREQQRERQRETDSDREKEGRFLKLTASPALLVPT